MYFYYTGISDIGARADEPILPQAAHLRQRYEQYIKRGKRVIKWLTASPRV